MNRTKYFNYIDNKLHVLAHRVETRGKLNLLELHVHSENFYLHFFNLLYEYNLVNLNKTLQNVEAIDLIDHKSKILIQVSSTNTKQKIESALSKEIIEKYSDYTFKFISIAMDATTLRKKEFANPYSISFNQAKDIFDITSIMSEILTFDIEKQKKVYQFIKNELGEEVDIVKLDTNLAAVINILSKEKWDESNKIEIVNSFEIDRKISYNNLDAAKDLVEEYKVYHYKVDEKYSEFDRFGLNKSNSVLASIKKEYLKIKDLDADELFFSVVEKIQDKVLNSANFVKIPLDELELCVDILVVDGFIRCKIFENPENYNYAIT